MGALMGVLGKLDFSKLGSVGNVDSMDIVWKQIDREDDNSSLVQINIRTTPLNENFGEVFLEMLKMVAGDKVTITKKD